MEQQKAAQLKRQTNNPIGTISLSTLGSYIQPMRQT